MVHLLKEKSKVQWKQKERKKRAARKKNKAERNGVVRRSAPNIKTTLRRRR